ncbi:MAG: peroxiredoxin [Alphaproteobacteria bacterium]|mgnify:FL=1|nr:peroxiredoxin [Alphaproteobacteria bacterium]|tara:strand:+ start:237 stop:728 length:492 start_codon:yes stop_codon:yes gene_type:complete
MALQVGDQIPEGELRCKTSEGVKPVSIKELFQNKRVVLFAVPGAFTPTCSARHLPGFVENVEKIKSKGIDTVACMSVNDVFVMDAWGKDQNTGDKIIMLADGAADYTKKLGLELDLNATGLGIRCKRFAMIIDNEIIKDVVVEEAGKFGETSAESILERLQKL